jgi:DNA-binding beta-propeller fold protein YncE
VGAAVPAGTDAYSITVDASGKFAYVANFGSANVSAYAINATTGALTALASSPIAAGIQPISIVTTRTIQ